ncbi:MAG TPA: ABC transporter permease [Actinocrinis sp.]|nr:ABC transporter permease [Actinocrinis sp.]
MKTLRRAWRLRSTKISLTILGVIAVLAVFGSHIAPQDPLAQNVTAALQGPGGRHWLGTDYLGRDVLSRLIAGTGRSVLGALVAVGIGLVLGVLPGLASLRLGRVFEWVTLRASDALMTLPYVVFAVAVTGILGNTLIPAMVAIGVILAPRFYRISRAAGLSLVRAQYVEAAELFGASSWWILRKHIWSKVLPTIAVTAAQALASALLLVSSLAFLGLGVQPPLPTWGELLSTDLEYLTQQPWAPLFPGLLIMISAGALNSLADAIRDSGAAEVLPELAGRSGRFRRAVEATESAGSPDSAETDPSTAKEQAHVPVPVG